jgi:hypothetical protein
VVLVYLDIVDIRLDYECMIHGCMNMTDSTFNATLVRLHV